MKTLTVRNLKPEVFEEFARRAQSLHRNPEAHARFLIEQEALSVPAETCGELCDRIWADPPPEVNEKAVDSYLAERGRRSPRP